MGKLDQGLKDFFKAKNSYTDLKDLEGHFKDFSNVPNEMILQLGRMLEERTLLSKGRRQQRGGPLRSVVDLLRPLAEEKAFERPMDNFEQALVATSVLRMKHQPVRMRCYFLEERLRNQRNYRAYWLCEVYNDFSEKWFLIDPANRYTTLLGGGQGSKTSAEMYRTLLGDQGLRRQVSYKRWNGLVATKQAVLDDLNSLMGRELLQEEWMISETDKKPAIYRKSIEALDSNEQEILYRIAIMMLHVDEHFDMLEDIYYEQIVKEW